MKRLGLLIAGAFLGLGFAAAAALVGRQLLSAAAPPDLHGMLLDSTAPAADFALPGEDGRMVRLSDFQGRLVLLYFGYTTCPDICPATLGDVARAVAALGAQAADVQVIMISVDPERDTPQAVAAYARNFDPNFIGLSGTLDQVTAAAAPFGIYFEKVEGGSQALGYLVNHTSTVTVVDRQGYVRLVWPFGVLPADMAADLRYLLSR